jgi:uncharacterized protein (DUF1499 family)
MKERIRQMIGYVALAITAIIIVSVFARIDNWQRDLSSNFAETDASSDDAALRPVTLNQSRDEVSAMIQQWADNQRDWQFVTEDRASAETKLHLTHATRLFRFVDDVHVTINDEAEGVTVNATSRSRIGKGDLGQNPRNLQVLMNAVSRLPG